MKLLFILLSLGSLLLDHGASFADTVSVSVFVMEGDSVTLNTCAKKTKQDTIKWYYKDIRIAQINGDLNQICTDVQCNGGNERFRDRLKLDHQTGSLTITDITNTDSGEYTLTNSSSSSDSNKIFSVSVNGVPAAEREVKRKEGESVTLDPGEIKITNDVMMWYFNDTLIAEITGDQSKIYTDDQCKERFRDRLKLDHQTGSLNITNTTDTDSGEYKLLIISGSNRHRRSASNNNMEIFKVTVTADPGAGLPDSGLPGSGLSVGAVVGIVGVLLVCVAVAFAVMYLRHRRNDVQEKQPRAPEESPINEMENDRGHVI